MEIVTAQDGKRFNSKHTFVSSSPEEREAWERTQRAWLAHGGVTEFEVMHDDASVTIQHYFTAETPEESVSSPRDDASSS
ncbi:MULTISPECIES: hypothetical protein [Nocardia]|uniref:Uncharacterized protein n=1 Tax=Nocardia nova TaxID=37330 RepID=A0A2T2Z8A9_9NOCA|nr:MULTISPECIES: hypothetical protein [Nocardia]PSR63981.1 hypothetical protein C8259_09015 [Nocardia nova]